jgi:hypothetical protein
MALNEFSVGGDYIADPGYLKVFTTLIDLLEVRSAETQVHHGRD